MIPSSRHPQDTRRCPVYTPAMSKKWGWGLSGYFWTKFFYVIVYFYDLALAALAIAEVSMAHAFEETTYMWTILIAIAAGMQIILFVVLLSTQTHAKQVASQRQDLNMATAYSSMESVKVKPLLYAVFYIAVRLVAISKHSKQ